MSKDYILAIDQGTTGSTVLIFDHAGTIKGRGYSEFTQHYPKPGWVEHDANEIWDVTHKVIGLALKDAGIAASDVHAIGITNQRETVVVWDRKTGEPIHHAIVWQDRRTASLCDELKKAGKEDLFRKKTGLLLDPYFSGTKIKWMLAHVDGARARAEKGELACGTIDTWLIWKLSGGKVHATDYSNASRTLLFNIAELKWDDELLGILDVPAALLPEVVPSSSKMGETEADAFYGATVPLAGVAGDQQAALFGQACYEEGMSKNTYGTGCFILMNTGSKPVFNDKGLLSTIAWGLEDGTVEYALEGSVFIAGAAVQWLRDGLKIIESASETEALAASLASNDGVYFVPALAGLGAPHWDPYARGTIVGLTRGTTRAHIVRAALEGICYQSKDVIDTMKKEGGLKLQTLRADGGATANNWLMQFQADIPGVTVEVPAISETTALGAAYLAGLATGFWSSRDELAQKWKCEHHFEPTMTDDQRTAIHAKWLEAIERARGWEK